MSLVVWSLSCYVVSAWAWTCELDITFLKYFAHVDRIFKWYIWCHMDKIFDDMDKYVAHGHILKMDESYQGPIACLMFLIKFMGDIPKL